jgi:hypothetical protein
MSRSAELAGRHAGDFVDVAEIEYVAPRTRQEFPR